MPTIIGGAFCYNSGFVVDADGCPRAYQPDDDSGLDYLVNAHGPGAWVSKGELAASGWFGVACNSLGVPVVQGADDPYPGYLVSCTSLVDHYKTFDDTARYVDSEKVPYISIARDLFMRGCKPGDLAWVQKGSLAWGAIIADVGPSYKYGEGSIALANQLSIPSSCRWREHASGCDSGVTWVVFPGSALAPAWPQPVDAIKSAAYDLFFKWGGEDRARTIT